MVKKILKVVLGPVALLAVCAGGFVAHVSLAWPIRIPVAAPDPKIEPTPERVARGKKLVSVRCAGGHDDQHTNALTGHEMADGPAESGRYCSRNVTRHPTRGVGRYTDGELAFLLRTAREKAKQ